jgi:cyanophycinase
MYHELNPMDVRMAGVEQRIFSLAPSTCNLPVICQEIKGAILLPSIPKPEEHMLTDVRTRKMFVQVLIVLLMVVTMVGQTIGASAAGPNPKYEYYVTGNPEDVVTQTGGGLLLMGGSTDVDAGFQWMIQKSGGGDFVVIRATGTDAYDPWIYNDLGGVDSAATLIIQNRAAASDPFVLEKILNAEALFIAGGDQANYVEYWKDTPVEDAINQLASRGVPVGGTSAGLAVLGQFVFSSVNGTVYSDTALSNPYNNKVALAKDFLSLPHMGNLITDSHFSARDRMGRLITFLARIVNDGWANQALGVGIDERTALAMEPNGSATVLGEGSVYFVLAPGVPEVCREKKALTYHNISVYRVPVSGTFNFAKWKGSGGTAYMLNVNSGVVTSTQPGGSIY